MSAGRKQYYRAYEIDHIGSLLQRHVLMAADDSEALRYCRTLPTEYGIDLWQDSRFVDRLLRSPA